MNAYLSSGLILILRWLMLLTRYQILGSFEARISLLNSLLDETTDYCSRLTKYTLNSHGMNDVEVDPNKKVM